MNFPQPQQPHDPLLIALIAKLAQKEGQPPPKTPAITLRDFFERFYSPRFLRTRPESVELCNTALNHLRTWLGHDPTLTEITPVNLSRFVNWLAARPGRSVETAMKNYRHIKAVCAYAAQLELMPTLPRMRMVDGDTEEEDEDDVPTFTLPEIEAMLTQAVALKSETAGHRDADLWVGIILVLYNTALRIATALSLCWKDYDQAQKCFHVRKGTQKTKKAQSLGITLQTAAYIDRLRRADTKPEETHLALGQRQGDPAKALPGATPHDGRGPGDRREGQGLSPLQGGHGHGTEDPRHGGPAAPRRCHGATRPFQRADHQRLVYRQEAVAAEGPAALRCFATAAFPGRPRGMKGTP